MLRDFFTFKSMITPKIIQIIFVVGTFLLVLAGVSVAVMSMLTGLGAGFGGGTGGAAAAGVFTAVVGLVGGLLYAVVGPLILRVYCEVLIIIFRINTTLNEMSATGTAILDATRSK
ncbi:MAG: hypothetical protein ACJAZO_002770 [Myxococcota bacterium]|jgi:hypothetical protein